MGGTFISRYEPLPEAVYVPDGGRFVPTGLAAGPWSPNGQHGGPPAALLAHAMERHDAEEEAADGRMLLARLTVELLRPVPLSPLDVKVQAVSLGRRAHRLEASLLAEGVEVARATGLRLPAVPLDLPDTMPAPPSWERSVPPPDEVAPRAHDEDAPWLTFGYAVDLRLLGRTWDEPGPGAAWARLLVPMIAGVETTPLMRVVATSDFTLGVGPSLPFDEFTFPNPDLTVALHRYPAGEWVCVDARSWVEPRGTGLSEGRLLDEEGPLGRAVQTLVVGRR